MKLDFNQPLLDLKGTPGRNQDGSEILLNQLLGNNLVQTTGKDNILKIFDWALTLQKTGVLDLDRGDQKLLKGMIENSETLFILSKGRLLEIFDKREAEIKGEDKEELKAV